MQVFVHSQAGTMEDSCKQYMLHDQRQLTCAHPQLIRLLTPFVVLGYKLSLDA